MRQPLRIHSHGRLARIEADLLAFGKFLHHFKEDLMSQTSDAIAELQGVKAQLVSLKDAIAALVAAAGAQPTGTIDPALQAAIDDVKAAAQADVDAAAPPATPTP